MSTLKEKQVESKQDEDQPEKNSENEDEDDEKELELAKWIVRKQDSFLIIVWKMLLIFMNLTSSYFYSWVAMYGEESVHESISYKLQIIYEGFFLVSIGINFITEYSDTSPDGDPLPVRDLAKIAKNYMDKGSFVIDFVTILPLYHITKSLHKFAKFINVIKIARLYLSLKHFNVTEIMKRIKETVHKRVLDKIKNDRSLENNTVLNQNMIEAITTVGYALKTFKLVLVIGNVSYFLGVFWMIFF